MKKLVISIVIASFLFLFGASAFGASEKECIHKVQEGQTFGSIRKDAGLPLVELKRLNPQILRGRVSRKLREISKDPYHWIFPNQEISLCKGVDAALPAALAKKEAKKPAKMAKREKDVAVLKLQKKVEELEKKVKAGDEAISFLRDENQKFQKTIEELEKKIEEKEKEITLLKNENRKLREKGGRWWNPFSWFIPPKDPKAALLTSSASRAWDMKLLGLVAGTVAIFGFIQWLRKSRIRENRRRYPRQRLPSLFSQGGDVARRLIRGLRR